MLTAFNQNLVFFHASQIVAKEAPVGRTFRLAAWWRPAASSAMASTSSSGDRHRAGGAGGLQRHPAGPVPRGQRCGCAGARWRRRVFRAKEVLAKHDENYMPPGPPRAVEKGASGARYGCETMMALSVEAGKEACRPRPP